MLRRLTLADDRQVRGFLGTNPAANLLIIGDIENFGYGCEFQELWGDHDSRGALRAVVLRYYDTYIVSAPGHYAAESVLRLLSERGDWQSIMGTESAMERLTSLLPHGRVSRHYLCQLDAPPAAPSSELPPGFALTRPGLCEVDAVLDLERRGFGKEPPASRRSGLEHELERDAKTVWAVAVGQSLVSMAETAAESSLSAMVIGVCTDPRYRRRGLATWCLYRLALDQLARGRTLCLFYDNPAAGRIYRRAGFRDVCRWTMLRR